MLFSISPQPDVERRSGNRDLIGRDGQGKVEEQEEMKSMLY